MAEIFLGRATGLEGFEKLVVLKKILPQMLGHPELTEMFLSEARLAATLQHPNIVQVYDVGVEEGSHFFAMEYVHGEDLLQIMRSSTGRGAHLPLDVALSIAIDVCSGLHYAHEKSGRDGAPLGIVHRDISPSNVLVSYDGTVKVADFGIAKVRSSPKKTQVGVVRGKYGYMSPEQCMTQPLDRRSDVFAVGIVLYEITTGVRLFKAASPYEAMRLAIEEDALPPSARRPNYPRRLDEIVMKALARDPGRRFATAQELQLALEEFARQERLAISSVTVARHMEELFGREIAEWRAASEKGRSLQDHLALTLPGRSRAEDEDGDELVVEETRSLPDPPKPARRRRFVLPLVGLAALAAAGGVWLGVRRDTGVKATTTVGNPPGTITADAIRLPWPPPPDATPRSVDDLRRAVFLLDTLDFEGADAALSALLTTDPKNGAALYYRALARGFGVVPSDRIGSAIDDALAVDQPPARRAILEAMVAFSRGQHTGNQSALAPWVEREPDNWELRYALSEMVIHGGDASVAWPHLQRAGEVAPFFLPPAHHALGLAAVRGAWADLETWAAMLERTEGGVDRGRSARMFARIAQGDTEGALALADDAERARVSGPAIESGRFVALVLLGRLDELERRLSMPAVDHWRSWRGDARPHGPEWQAWLALRAGKRDVWLRWVDKLDDGKGSGGERLGGICDQAIIAAIVGETALARERLERARGMAGPAGRRELATAAALVAFREGKADALDGIRADRPILGQALVEAVRQAQSGDRPRAIATLRAHLEHTSETLLLPEAAWLLVAIADGKDEDAARFACGFIIRPRGEDHAWPFTLAACPR
jgi:serine/threonine protein kinase